ncbi:hypothetical protein HBH98_241720 [Parastagonospora nodorum]|nr:hypothetical protein HBI06_246000 [Parastagonospora nodorum]KAH4224342.1 hypothetical protein HBI05_239050 [Parastagonospora nodorum]KAH4334399.1 hypothetical protein HBH98_241720 [Parastagonospora nodorum]KAH4374725.1 hypothetical protein HBH99_220600 [Parastagonospora nodorum]KAH4382436.1 hypothetical protein HBH97_085370 [Parastagonospora nodorum]
MTQPAQDNSPEVSPKWLKLRKKHENETRTFQAMVDRNRDEFEARVDRKRKELLAQHSREEQDFWKTKRGAGTVRADTKAMLARTQTRRGSVAPSKTTTLQPSRLATPRMPITSARRTQHPQYTDMPPASKRSTRRAGLRRNSGHSEVIEISSGDDDDASVTKKQPTVQKKSAQKSAAEQSNARNGTVDDAVDIDGGQKQPRSPFSMPEATLELFGRSSLNPQVCLNHSIRRVRNC